MNEFHTPLYHDVAVIRERTRNMMEKLRRDTQAEVCWMGKSPNNSIDAPPADASSTTSRRDFQKRFFDRHGFLIVKKFVDMDITNRMKAQMKNLVDSSWSVKFENDSDDDDGTTNGNTSTITHKNMSDTSSAEAVVFRTDDKQEKAQGSNAYFLQSATEIHFFAEQDAMSDVSEGRLKSKFRDDKAGALNKCGHAIHLHPLLFTAEDDAPTPNNTAAATSNVFHAYSTSPSIRELVIHTLGYVNPVIPQSMYIFKQPLVGSEVTSHQDSTFLFTEPKQTCLGLWLALDDSTIENGCLWVRPKSHMEPLRRKFARNPDYFYIQGKEKGDRPPLMIFQGLVDDAATVPWEGSLPKASWPPPCDGLFDAGFVPVECNAGDLVVFGGMLDHLSLPNYSCKQRHTFQLHLVEGTPDIKWAESNWLQYPKHQSFLSLKKDV